jgi:CYTH domain-containing protein/CHAD domain-containing protein
MAEEVEHRFVIRSDKWRKFAKNGTSLRQGYLFTDPHRSVRIRVKSKEAVITLKGNREGISRQEFKYPIPIDDAQRLLEEICIQPVLEKVRYAVTFEGRRWEIDEFKNENEGLVIAELELDSKAERFRRPEWLGEEVSEDERFSDASLVRHPFQTWRKETVFQLKRTESVADGLLRAFREQLDASADALLHREKDLEGSVHEARKSLKKARALLRLARPVLGPDYSRANNNLRDLGRSLSELRDAHALVETAGQMEESLNNQEAHGAFEHVRRVLIRREEEIRRHFEARAEVQRIIGSLHDVTRWAGHSSLERAGANTITRSVKITIRRGRRAFEAAFSSGDPDDYHEWRKRAKDMRYQLGFLKELWPDVLEAYSKSAEQLEQALGEDHNLSVLRGMITRDSEYEQKEIRLMLPIIKQEQQKLRNQAGTLGTMLYADQPKHWATRLDCCWQAWQAPSH